MGRLANFLGMVESSRLLAPNLRTLKLTVYSGNAHRGNAVARAIVQRHLLALRWMNPNAQVSLHAVTGQGTPRIEYELWSGVASAFDIAGRIDEDVAVAKVLMAARDPEDDSFSKNEAASAAAVAGASPTTAAGAGAEAAKAAGPAASATVASQRLQADATPLPP